VAVAPSLLSADFSRLGEEIAAAEKGGADFLHLDIMDAHFVPNLTFGPFIVEAIARLARVPLVSHLMIDDPGAFAERFVKAGSAAVTFHWEACGAGCEKVIERIHGAGCDAGLAINPATPFEAVTQLLRSIDLLLIMTVNPGFGGQEFIASCVDKLREAARLKKEKGYRYVLEVDGGIKPANAALVREAGAQILVAGTAVFKSPDYAGAIAELRG
jgi:ribulose-phosphate 3-epimerase